MILFLSMPLFWVGVSLFSFFAYTAPEDCPNEYMTTKKHGGTLENAGDIYTYCTPDANWRWRLKEDAKVTFDDVLKEEKK